MDRLWDDQGYGETRIEGHRHKRGLAVTRDTFDTDLIRIHGFVCLLQPIASGANVDMGRSRLPRNGRREGVIGDLS